MAARTSGAPSRDEPASCRGSPHRRCPPRRRRRPSSSLGDRRGRSRPCRNCPVPPTAIRHASLNSSSRSRTRTMSVLMPLSTAYTRFRRLILISARFLLGDVFADACRSDHIAGSRPQHRIVPANEPTLARTCEDLVLVMPCFGHVGEERRENIFHIVNFGRYEKLEPVSPDNFLVSPTGQAEQVLVAVGDPRFAVEHQ